MPYGDDATTDDYRLGRALRGGLEPRVGFSSKRPPLDSVKSRLPGDVQGGSPSMYQGAAPTQSKFNPQLAQAHGDLQAYKERFGREWMRKNNTDALTPQQKSSLPDQLNNALEQDQEYQKMKAAHRGAISAHVQGLTPEQYQSNQAMAQRPGIVNTNLQDENVRANNESTANVGLTGAQTTYTNTAADRVKQMTPVDVASGTIENDVTRQKVLTPEQLQQQRAAEIIQQQAQAEKIRSEAALNTASAGALGNSKYVDRKEHDTKVKEWQSRAEKAEAALDQYRRKADKDHGLDALTGGGTESKANFRDEWNRAMGRDPSQASTPAPTPAPAQAPTQTPPAAPAQPSAQTPQAQPAGQPISLAGGHTLTPQPDGTYVHPSGAIYKKEDGGYRKVR